MPSLPHSGANIFGHGQACNVKKDDFVKSPELSSPLNLSLEIRRIYVPLDPVVMVLHQSFQWWPVRLQEPIKIPRAGSCFSSCRLWENGSDSCSLFSGDNILWMNKWFPVKRFIRRHSDRIWVAIIPRKWCNKCRSMHTKFTH